MAPVDLERDRAKLVVDLKQRKFEQNSFDMAKAIVVHLRKVVAHAKYTNINELLDAVRKEGQLLVAARPLEFIVVNMVLRVLKLIREERVRLYSGLDEVTPDQHDSLHTLWESQSLPPSVDRNDLKIAMIETLTEFLQEMEFAVENVASVAPEHINANETVLTYSHSHSIQHFILAAARKRRFRVIVAKGSPDNQGEKLATTLKEASAIKTKDSPKFSAIEIIEDCAMAAVMSQVTKVIIGAHAVLADGGFIGSAGVYALALAAKRFAVPVIVVAPFYKLTPKFLSSDDQERFNELRGPLDVFNGPSTYDLMGKVTVYHTSHDYVPPELVSLYLMQASANAPSYVYRLLGEYFHPDDLSNRNL